MSKLAILTTRHNQYPGIDTYTYYEFMALSNERLNDLSVLYISDRQSTKHMRKLRRRAAPHDVWIKILKPLHKLKPTTHLSSIFVNIKEDANPGDIRKAILGRLREVTNTMLQNAGYDPNKLQLPNPGVDDPPRRPVFGTKLKATRPPIGRLFNSKFELADHVVGMMPIDTEMRKRNALKYHICCKLKEPELVALALHEDVRHTLVSKFC